jgi:hypothetical protein
MPSLSLHRDPAFADMLRAYEIFVDGSPRGTIRQKQSVDIEVEPGRHRVQLRIAWCSSPELEVDAAGEVRLRCRSNVKPFRMVHALQFQKDDWIRLWREG